MRRLSTLWIAGLALAAFVGLGLSVRYVIQRRDSPDPVAYDTLMRFLPPGAELLELHASGSPGIYRFRAKAADRPDRPDHDPGPDFRGEITSDGTLLWLASQVAPAALPRALRDALLPTGLGTGERLERFEVMAFAVSTGGSVRYLDPFGESLLETGQPSSDPQLDEAVDSAQKAVPAGVRRGLEEHFAGALAQGIRRRRSLGATVWRAAWSSLYGDQEVEILESGLTQLVELPDDEPIPAAIASSADPGSRPTATLLYAYGVSGSAGNVERLALAAGRPVEWTFAVRDRGASTR